MPVRSIGGAPGAPGPGGTATVVWGPDFGESNDLVQSAAASMPAVKQTIDRTMGGSPLLSLVKLAGGVVCGAAPAHAEKQTMNVTAGAQFTGGVQSQVFTGPTGAGAVTFPTVKQTINQTMAGAPTFPAVTQTVARTMGSRVTTLQYTTSTIIASKDCWCDVINLCPVDVNRNTQDLQLDGTTATRKEFIVGWDLSGFPTGATVTAATITVGLKTAPTVSQSLSLWTISAANEAWTESTVRCSNFPIDVAIGTSSVAVGTTAGPRDVSWPFIAAGLTALQGRMGVGSFSMRTAATVGLTNCVFESKDEGTDNALGPRLTITFTIPT